MLYFSCRFSGFLNKMNSQVIRKNLNTISYVDNIVFVGIWYASPVRYRSGRQIFIFVYPIG
jgi:hypothetical protein